jgi:hypothetical protein
MTKCGFLICKLFEVTTKKDMNFLMYILWNSIINK